MDHPASEEIEQTTGHTFPLWIAKVDSGKDNKTELPVTKTKPQLMIVPVSQLVISSKKGRQPLPFQDQSRGKFSLKMFRPKHTVSKIRMSSIKQSSRQTSALTRDYILRCLYDVQSSKLKNSQRWWREMRVLLPENLQNPEVYMIRNILSRMASFREWSHETIRTGPFVDAGFSCKDPHAHTVECTACGIVLNVTTLNGISPLEYHKQKSPECQFLRENGHTRSNDNHQGRESGPLVQIDEAPGASNIRQVDSPYRGSATSDPMLPNRPRTGELFERPAPAPNSNNITSSGEAYVENENIIQGAEGGDTPYPIRNPRYTEENARRETYRHWPHHGAHDIEVLVTAGFFYTGAEDIVRCFYCDIGLAEWNPEDDPWVEHARHSPDCPFLRNEKGQEYINRIQAQWARIYTPKHPEYSQLDARRRTFENSQWPRDNVLQTPEMLTSAGFFYTGEGDTVRCHYCDGGLREWEPQDDPWVEHARWFPFCKFVLKIKGIDFIQACATGNPENQLELPVPAAAAPAPQPNNAKDDSRKDNKTELSLTKTKPQVMIVSSSQLAISSEKRRQTLSFQDQSKSKFSLEVLRPKHAISKIRMSSIKQISRQTSVLTRGYILRCLYDVQSSNLKSSPKWWREMRVLLPENLRNPEVYMIRNILSRMASFREWSHNAIRTGPFVDAGFSCKDSHTHTVECTACGIVLNAATLNGISPLEYHKQKSPECQFLRENGHIRGNNDHQSRESRPQVQTHEAAGAWQVDSPHIALATSDPVIPNRPRTGELFERPAPAPNSNNITSSGEAVVENENIIQGAEGGDTPYPIHNPRYTEENARRETYRRWPHRGVHDIEVMITAGFYYTGAGDVVRCFYCDIGLAKWNPEDDPWVEHARHSPDCPFLRNEKGQEYIDRILAQWARDYTPRHPEYSQLDASRGTLENSQLPRDNVLQTPEMLTNGGFFYTAPLGATSCSDDLTPSTKGMSYEERCRIEEQRNPMCSAAAISLWDMGYSRETIMMAINSFTSRHGRNNFKARDLMKIILEREERVEGYGEDSAAQEALLRENENLRRRLTCKVCERRGSCILFVPCGHRITCKECGENATVCLYCGQRIEERYKTYLR